MNRLAWCNGASQLQHTARHCNTLQHTATQRSTRKVWWCVSAATHCDTLQHTATHCNTLLHTAAYCNTLQRKDRRAQYGGASQLQHTATHCNTLRHSATHYNTLQHTTTHCNTLQHTATHCNAKIDAHSAVVRLNEALVPGFEQDVVSRTTHRVIEIAALWGRDFMTQVFLCVCVCVCACVRVCVCVCVSITHLVTEIAAL